MRFDQFVKKHTRGIFIFIIVMMAVPLTINFGPGGCDPDVSDGGGEAGVIFDGHRVPRSEYVEAHNASYGYHRWRFLSSGPMASMRGQLIQHVMRQGGRWWNDPKTEELEALAWERIVLRRYASNCGVVASAEEAASEIRTTYSTAQPGPWNRDQYAGFVRTLFSCDVPAFERMVQDSIQIEKFLALELDGPGVGYPEIYARLLKEGRRYRVQVAAFNPEDFVRELVSPGSGEIQKFFEEHKSRFETPAKCQLEYLMADVEKIKATLPEPAEEELKKYYDENKDQFAKPAAAGQGDDDGGKPAIEHKPFEEVRLEIAGKVKARNAEKAAYETMKRVNAELGQVDAARRKAIAEAVSKDPAFADKGDAERKGEAAKRLRAESGDILQKLAETFKAEAGGLVHDITILFAERQMADVEKTIGKPTGSFNLSNWIFDTAVAGDIVNTVVKTDKGALLARLSRKAEAYTPDLSEPLRRQIAKELAKDKLKERAQKSAQEIVRKIQASPAPLAAFADLRATVPSPFRSTRYFQASGSDDVGLDDHSLNNAVRNAVSSKPDEVRPGFATEIQGSSVGGEKKEWTFVAVVEDVASEAPEGSDSKFATEREEAEKADRQRRRDELIKKVVAMANVRDKMKKGKAEEPATP